MSNTTLKEHLLLCVQRLKTYTNSQVLELNEAVVAALEEIIDALEGKADSESVNTALAGKADAQATTTALNSKADSSNVSQALALKANTADVSGALAFFNSSKLYIDADGDVAQGN
jgi:hypothetical protein